MRSPIVSAIKFVVVVSILAALGVTGYAAYSRLPAIINELVAPPGKATAPAGEEVIVAIPKGASLSQVGIILQEKGVISSRLVFKLVAMIRGEQRSIKAGDYALKTGSDAGDVLDQLISGKTFMISLTIPEGFDMYQVADLFNQAGIMSRDDFLITAEDPVFLKELNVDASSLEGFPFSGYLLH